MAVDNFSPKITRPGRVVRILNTGMASAISRKLRGPASLQIKITRPGRVTVLYYIASIFLAQYLRQLFEDYVYILNNFHIRFE